MNTLNAVQMLDAVTKNTSFDNVGDALAYGIPTSLFGFAVVFCVLIVIWGILALFKVFFYTIPNARKKSQNKVKAEQKPKAEVKPVAEAPAAPVVQAPSTNDGEVVAAIIAAIEAYRAQSGSAAPGGFRVVSFKKRF